MNWKSWPYWLKGGVIGGGVTLIFGLSWYTCSLFGGGGTPAPGETGDAFFCLSLWAFSPMFPVALLIIKFIGPLLSKDSGSIVSTAFLITPVVSVVFWFILGSLIGTIVGKFKKKSPPLR